MPTNAWGMQTTSGTTANEVWSPPSITQESGRCGCPGCVARRAREALGFEPVFAEHDEDEDPDDGYGSDDEDLDFARVSDERPLSATDTAKLPAPLLRFLRNGGRRWSAEVEVNGIGPNRAGDLLGAEIAGYVDNESRRNGAVMATPDCTVDAEIKLSRMRDGNTRHAATCRQTYARLRNAGATVGYNCGHHVHIDAQRIAEMGTDTAFEVVQTAAIVGRACDATLYALAASGFGTHRADQDNDYGTYGWCTSDDVLSDRYTLHGSRLGSAITYENPGAATIEYRLPNGTLEPIRAHAHIAIPLALVDLAERAILDHDKVAREAVRRAKDSPYGFDEAAGARYLTTSLHLHEDSYRALAISADTSPMAATAREAFKSAAKRFAKAA